MKRTTIQMGAVLLAMVSGAMTNSAPAQVAVNETTTETRTTNVGTIAEFGPGSETVVVTSRTNPRPTRYSVTRETTFVDETGAPVRIQRSMRGTPVTVHGVRSGDRVVASRVEVRGNPERITKAEAKALREYYDELEGDLEDGVQKAEAKAQKEYYDSIEEELED